MYCEQNSVRTCEVCGFSGLCVTQTRVDGDVIPLCPDCNQETLGGDSA
ncbi:hypothetical protein [Salinibaculum salinum]